MDAPLIALTRAMLQISTMLRVGHWMFIVVMCASVCASHAWAQAVPDVAPASDPDDDSNLSDELHEAESRLATGRLNALADPITVTRGLSSADARIRAQACHVAAWLPGEAAVSPLLIAADDGDERVRLAAVQSLSFLVRRSEGDQRDAIRAVLLARIDDAADAVACAAIEWFAADSPAQTATLVPKAALASDIRYACFRRVTELPARAVIIASVNRDVAAEPLAPPVVEAPDLPFSWLSLATGAVAGAAIGAAIPSALVPSRDVLVYTSKQSRYFRQSTSFLGQLGGALGGAVLLGGGAVALDVLLGETAPSAQVGAALATAAGALGGAGAGFAWGRADSIPIGFAVGSGLGLSSGLLLARLAPPTTNGNALAAGVGLVSGVGGALALAAALPVNLTVVGNTDRTEFLFGASVATMGVATVVGLAASSLVDLSVGRSCAIAAGALAGAGLAGGVAFAAIPNIETKSRIAAAVALGGLALGAVGGVFWPSSWLPDVLADVAVAPTVAAVAAGADVVTTIGAAGQF